MVEAAREHPGCLIPYITQARQTSKDILWPALIDINRQFDLGLSFKENTGDITSPNGSKIILRGAGTRREMEKLRGIKFPLAVVDEAQAFTKHALEYLLEDVISPAQVDYGNIAQIYLIGTPNAARAGHFFDLIREEKHPHHHWTLLDNPHLPNPAEWLKNKRERMGWDSQHPTYLREYCGEWVRDSEGLVYRVQDFNLVSNVPHADDYIWVLGLDLGFNDPTAFVVLCYSMQLGKTFVYRSFEKTGLTPSAVAAHCEKLNREFDFARIVADTGGFGKGYAEEMRQKHGLPVIPAQKQDKAAFIEMLNGDLSSGTLQIQSHSNRDLVEQVRLLQWNTDKMDQGIMVSDNRFSDHLSDALLYGWRECMPHNDEWEEAAPSYGTREYWDKREAKIEEQLAAKILGEGDSLEWFDEHADSDAGFLDF